MRHGKSFNHLSRKPAHRKAMLSNMASSLILHKRITTTVAKAKALRKYVEPLITKSKTDTTHSRRTVFSYLRDKESIKILFDEISDKVAERPGGYTRIIKTGNRLGDNAEMCIMELVDYNELMLEEASSKPDKAKTRRSRKGKTTEASAPSVTKETKKAEEVAEKTAKEVEKPTAETKKSTEESKEKSPEAAATEDTAEAKEEKVETKQEEEVKAEESPEAEKTPEEPAEEDKGTAADTDDDSEKK